MKRFLYSILALAAALSCTGCGDDELKKGSGGPAGGDNPGGGGEAVFTPVTPAPREWDGEKRADISYQLLVYSFADSNGDGVGDFQGIIDKLDYLDQLGVSAVWLSPVHPAMSYHGYDVLDYGAINPQYGTEADFQRLIDAAHGRGIRIYMDYVINHTGKDHPWFAEALGNPDSPYRDYYVLSENPAQDIRDGKIPSIASEGAAGYDAGQWFAAVQGDGGTLKVKFTLRWSANPTLSVERVETVENSGSPSSGKYLYFGDPARCVEFYTAGDDLYTLALEFSSPWGCLVRTSQTSWAAGTKYGARSGSNRLAWGVPMTLQSNASADPADVLMPGMTSVMYHSHFWTSWFADLNYGPADRCAESPAFRAICASTRKWIDMGIDGLRLDGAKHIYHNARSNENPTFWNSFYTAVNDYFRAKNGRDIYMVGEVYSDFSEAAPYYAGLPALFDFSYWYRLEWALNNSTGCYFVRDILSYRDRYATYRPDYIEATKLTNHDENRARSLLGGSTEKAKLAGAVLLTSCGSPYIYYGEELGFVGKKDNGDEYVRPSMKWGDSHSPSYTDKVYAGMDSVADAAAQAADEGSILGVYRSLGQLRNTYPALAVGEMKRHPVYNENNANPKSIAAWYRETAGERLLVVHNFDSQTVTIELDDAVKSVVWSMNSVAVKNDGGKTSVRMGSCSSVIFQL